jgi:pyruvate dehydrogenase E2 component (dihydrolipoamide acetyltransferase)
MGVDPDQITGSGPGGRVTSNDIRRVATQRGQEPDVTVDVPSQGVNASPKAKRLAKELQVELRGLKGTGVAGMIRVKDVELAAQTAITTSAGGDRLSLSKLRQTVALRTQESKQTIPHFYLMVDVDMTQVNRLRSYCLENLGWQRPPTYTDILVRACALALVDMPEANRSYNKGGWIVRQRIAIGVAVNTDQGLMVPVIRDADKLSLQDTVAALKAVAGRAREGRLRQTDLGEKSMVISNLGMYSVDTFIAIIDMPDPMILAVGRVADRLVPVDGQAVIRPMCTLTLSVDHRVLDGVQGAQFLERLKDRLENPFEVMG